MKKTREGERGGQSQEVERIRKEEVWADMKRMESEKAQVTYLLRCGDAEQRERWTF